MCNLNIDAIECLDGTGVLFELLKSRKLSSSFSQFNINLGETVGPLEALVPVYFDLTELESAPFQDKLRKIKEQVCCLPLGPPLLVG
jgi:hypothetical protein